MNKSNIYLEAEDDITSVIEKVKAAESNIVALVPTKRMPVLQSAVNLKLLKRESIASAKKIVLITTEANLIPLAGTIKLHVASGLNSKPYIPDVPETDKEEDLVLDDTSDLSDAADTPVGILDKTRGTNLDEEPSKVPKQKSKKLLASLPKMKGRIPNFNKFRMKLIIGGTLLVLFSIGWYLAFYVAPKATIQVNAQTNRVKLELDFTLDAEAQSDDLEKQILVPSVETLKKSFSATVPVTGEKNVGPKAKGNILVKNCFTKGVDLELPTGTIFISSTGKNFKSDESVSVEGGTDPGTGCTTSEAGEASVSVTAVQSGESSNVVNGIQYSISGYDSRLWGIGGPITGGVDDIQKVVAQSDIDDAAATLVQTIHDEAADELEVQFSKTLVPLPTTFKINEGKPKAEPAVGESAEEVVVTLVYTYTMQGVSLESLSAMLDAKVAEQLGEDVVLEIYDNGLDDAAMVLIDSTVNLTTNSFVGPELDERELAEEVSGLRFSAARDLLLKKEGVNSVTIDLDPFWVFSLPSADKIQVSIDIAAHALQ